VQVPPPSEPASPLSTNRHLLLLVLAHHLLEETSRINNKAFQNIGFHTMQVVSQRSGINRIVQPRWSFVKPSTCSTPRIPSRPSTTSSGGRYVQGPCGSGGSDRPQSAAGSTQPSHPRNVDPLTSGDSKKRARGPEVSKSNKQQRPADPAPSPPLPIHTLTVNIWSRLWEMGADHQYVCLPPA
jgi:hypothetical protein